VKSEKFSSKRSFFTFFSYICAIKLSIMKRTSVIYLLMPVLLLASCKQHYEVASMQRSRIVVDARYDAQPDQKVADLLKPYKHQVDSVMGPVVGRSTKYMTAKRPEGTLSNLLADILVWAAKDYGEQPDLGLYNMGGVRADLPKGKVTYGDVLDVAPFENKISFVTLKGDVLLELFAQIASVGGEGLSRSVRMVITKDGLLESVTVNGQPIDPQKEYRVTTIDYLLGGTDKMEAFKKGTNINAPKDASNNTRFIIMNYFREMDKQGKVVDSEIEGRVTIAGDALKN
jgi:2',3'-cyclic-nucleotide 2'-phosphodiesterase (5'-nucleotidase family)